MAEEIKWPEEQEMTDVINFTKHFLLKHKRVPFMENNIFFSMSAFQRATDFINNNYNNNTKMYLWLHFSDIAKT